MANDKLKFTKIAAIPKWQLSSPAKESKPTEEGSDLDIRKKVSGLDSMEVGSDVMLCCKGKLKMKRAEERESVEDVRYEVEVMEIAVMKSQKDLMNETMQGA